jgi:phosphoenolpyruvate synthase/pyruvate phosphate dikinase
MAKPEAESYIRWFGEIGIKDVPLVGGETASLAEMAKICNIDICGQGQAIAQNLTSL